MRPDADDGEKRTNEIGTVIPLPDIAGRTVTADALLTQRALASYLLDRGADYLFTVKGNQKTLLDDIQLTLNRGHWTVEATHHILDWSFDEDRSRIRTGHGPENMTLLRRSAIGLIKGPGLAVAETMRNPARKPRRVIDFLKMTDTVAPRPVPV